MKLVLPFLLLFSIHAIAGTIATECDSLFLSNGSVYAVKNVDINRDGILFSYCNDTTNARLDAPWMQVHHIKKADGTIIYSGFEKQVETPLSAEQLEMEKKVDALFSLSIIAFPAVFFFGVGLLLSIVVLAQGAVLIKKTGGHPNEKYLRRRIKRARPLAKINLFAFLLLALIVTSAFIVFILQFSM